MLPAGFGVLPDCLEFAAPDGRVRNFLPLPVPPRPSRDEARWSGLSRGTRRRVAARHGHEEPALEQCEGWPAEGGAKTLIGLFEGASELTGSNC